jgi:hypothetical protein
VWIIQPQFDWAENFSNGLAPVSVGKRWGVIDRSGELRIKPRFEQLGRFSPDFAVFKLDGKYGFLEKSGAITIPAQFDSAYDFVNGLALVNDKSIWAYINTRGKRLISFVWNEENCGMD